MAESLWPLVTFAFFQEWHLKCSHYFILVASKGEASFAPPAFSRMEGKKPKMSPLPRVPVVTGGVSILSPLPEQGSCMGRPDGGLQV